MTRERVKEALDCLIAKSRDTGGRDAVAAEINAVEEAVDSLVNTSVSSAVAVAHQQEHTRRVERIAGQILAAYMVTPGVLRDGWSNRDIKAAVAAADALVTYIDKGER